MVRIGNQCWELNNATRHLTRRLFLALLIPNLLPAMKYSELLCISFLEPFVAKTGKSRVKICVELYKKVLENKYWRDFSNFV